jgi:RNA polymerase sigma-70 factor (ECF subfamily)
MDEANPFLDLIYRVRRGESAAAAELVQRYEPAVRRAIRFRLRDSRLRRLLDSMDIFQSVMASFFFRAALGQYDLQEPEQLVKLLVVMARNKLVSQARKPEVVYREEPLHPLGDLQPEKVLAPGPSPSQMAAGRELLQTVRGQLTPADRQLLDRRTQGLEWLEIAAELGGTPEALRKRLARALNRVAHRLGLDDLNDE